MIDTITDVPGVLVGHHTDGLARTGVTVLTFAEPNVGAADVRGGAPGTRELGLFGDAIKPVTINALMFAGGSAFGLGAAQGVMEELEKQGLGAPTPAGPVPIVPGAIIFDLMVGDANTRPVSNDGKAAYRARTSDPVVMGAVGAGSGATVGKIQGFGNMTNAGIGSASASVDGAVVGSLVVLNAVGDVFALDGRRITGSDTPDGPMSAAPQGTNTTLIAVATNADVTDRNELRRMAVRAHDALAATVRPAHTRYDGDTAFVVASPSEAADIDAVVEATFDVVARAIVRAVAEET
ncbi:MAG: peptidase S58 family protein [Proteobacteria bacterium]|nr:peptidase S58 family protein [Pseudomonadota bacterium]